MPEIFASASWPDTIPDRFDQLTWREMVVLASKLRAGQRRALKVARHSRSLHEIWDMIRLINELTGVADDVNRALARSWPA